jgi:hypothetical protein
MKITNMFTPHSSLSPRLARRLAVTAMFVFGWLPSVVESRAATLSWTGGGANANWNNSANWGGARARRVMATPSFSKVPKPIW